MMSKLSKIDEEVIFLDAIKELIDSMVNYGVLELHGQDPDSSVSFKTSAHQKLFNVLLTDFLSCTDKRSPVKQESYLSALKSIVTSPSFDVSGSVMQLKEATHAFADWIEQEVEEKTWLPSIDTETVLRLSRFSFIKICGNICKHNILRNVGTAEELRAILSRAGVSVPLEDALLAMDDFYEWFHTNIFNYHASTIAELLNEIRWGIYGYLKPECDQSIVRDKDDPISYRWTFPSGLTNGYAKACYWNLMNDMRNPPYMRHFKVTKYLKMRY